MSSGSGSERNRVIIRYTDGRMRKGFTHDFTPVKDSFHVVSQLDEDRDVTYEVDTADLKAVFFVKTFEGDPDYHEKNSFECADPARLQGLKIMVKFRDGEVLRGMSLGYNKAKKGFFIMPLDPLSNNERIFVLAHALEDVQVGPAAEKTDPINSGTK